MDTMDNQNNSTYPCTRQVKNPLRKQEMAATETASQLLEETAVNCCCWNELELGADPLAGMS